MMWFTLTGVGLMLCFVGWKIDKIESRLKALESSPSSTKVQP
jgi:hypothetical protein